MADKLQRLGYAKQTFLQGVREEGSDIIKTVASPMIDLLFDYLDSGAFGAAGAAEASGFFYWKERQCLPQL
jgi:hypothetical protein